MGAVAKETVTFHAFDDTSGPLMDGCQTVHFHSEQNSELRVGPIYQLL